MGPPGFKSLDTAFDWLLDNKDVAARGPDPVLETVIAVDEGTLDVFIPGTVPEEQTGVVMLRVTPTGAIVLVGT